MDPIDSSTSEARLVAAAKSGDARAFREIVSRFHTMVYALALAKMRDHDAAEDIVQEVFLRVYLHLDRLTKPQYLGTWIGRITRNLAADWAARSQRSSYLLPTIPLDDSHADLKERHVKPDTEKMDDATREKALNDAIRDLPTEQREIILLHFMQGWNYREIAARLEKDPTTISRILQRTLETLRAKVGDALDAPSATPLRPRASAARTIAMLAALSALPIEAKASLAAATQAAVAASSINSGASFGPVAALARWFKLLSLGNKAVVVAVSLGAAAGTGVVAEQQLAPAHAASPVATAHLAASPVPITWDVNAPGLEGPWCAEHTFPRIGLQRVVILITRNAEGKYAALLYNRDEASGALGPMPVVEDGQNISIKSDTHRPDDVSVALEARRTNSSTISGKLIEGKMVTDMVLTRVANTPQRPMPKPHTEIAADPKSFEKYAGYYAANSQQIIRIRVDNGAFVITTPRLKPMRLYPEGGDKFFSKEVEMECVFNLDASGAPLSVTLNESRDEHNTFRRVTNEMAHALDIPWIKNGDDNKPLEVHP